MIATPHPWSDGRLPVWAGRVLMGASLFSAPCPPDQAAGRLPRPGGNRCGVYVLSGPICGEVDLDGRYSVETEAWKRAQTCNAVIHFGWSGGKDVAVPYDFPNADRSGGAPERVPGLRGQSLVQRSVTISEFPGNQSHWGVEETTPWSVVADPRAWGPEQPAERDDHLFDWRKVYVLVLEVYEARADGPGGEPKNCRYTCHADGLEGEIPSTEDCNQNIDVRVYKHVGDDPPSTDDPWTARHEVEASVTWDPETPGLLAVAIPAEALGLGPTGNREALGIEVSALGYANVQYRIQPRPNESYTVAHVLLRSPGLEISAW